jgi:hypothetical protein
MQNAVAPRSEPMLNRSMFGPAPEAQYRHYQSEGEDRADHQFVAMLDSYRDSGGLARLQEVGALFKHRCGCDLTLLASWIANKKVICFEWQSEMWLPLFQFNRFDMTLQPGLSLILAELSSDFDAWQLAHWFAQPNPWLGNRSPAAMLGPDQAAVLDASRSLLLTSKNRHPLIVSSIETENCFNA